MGIATDGVTLLGLGLGLGSALLIAGGMFFFALVLLLSRLADGLDSAVARATRKTDFGGYLDITADFLFYGSVPLAFAIVDPAAAVAAACRSDQLWERHQLSGLRHPAKSAACRPTGREKRRCSIPTACWKAPKPLVFFVLLCLFPAGFARAWAFGTLRFATAVLRVIAARRLFGSPH